MTRRILSTLCALLLLSVLTVPAYAAEVPDLTREGSVFIAMTHEDKPVPGGTITAYRVAGIHVENDADYSFRYVQVYADCRVSLEDLNSDEVATELAIYTEANAIEGVTLTIDESGCVTFEGLELGLYLLVQQTPADGYYAASPFLVSVPSRQNGAYVYDVEASPKLDLEAAPTVPTEPTEPEPTEPEPTDPELPQTGMNNWPVPVLAVSGLACIVLGWWLNAAEKRKSHGENR